MGLAERIANRHLRASIRLPVPIVPQTADFSCGSACLLACLLYWKGNSLTVEREPELWGALNMDPTSGVEADRIAAVARRFGLLAASMQNMTVDALRGHLERGETVILCLQAWRDNGAEAYRSDWEDAHFVVLVGLDSMNAYFMDPMMRASYGWMSTVALHERWHSPDARGGAQHQVGIMIRGSVPAISSVPRIRPMV